MDTAAKEDLHALILRLAAEGAIVLLASTDPQELLTLTHRILVLRAGRRPRWLSAAGLTEARLMTVMNSPIEEAA